MKRIIVMSFAFLAILVGTASADMSIHFDANPADRLGTTSGGEFEVTVLANPDGYGIESTSFKTFCVQLGEGIGTGDYLATISTNTVAGNKPLQAGTAYLYNWWLDQGRALALVSADPDAEANALQRAIWHIQGEAATTNSAALALVGMANTAVGDNNIWGNTIGLIRILNITTTSGANKQDQLIRMVPAPGAVLLGFLGLGWAGMKLRKRV